MLDSKRLRHASLFEKIVSPDEAAWHIEDHHKVGISGFTPSGYPKETTLALADQIAKGRKCAISVWTGASVGPEVEESLAAVHGIENRTPYYSADNKIMRRQINSGEISYTDVHLSHFAQEIEEGFFGDVDVAIVEALAITEEGHLILGPGIGNTPTLVKHAKKVIVEVNTSIPLELEGMHDIYTIALPPHRKEIPIYKADDRIGTTYLPCGLDKITCIVEGNRPDFVRPLREGSEQTKAIARNLIQFLEEEQRKGHLPDPLLPIQSGVGAIANAVLQELRHSNFKDLTMYSEILQDAVFTLIKEGKIKCASGCAFTPSAYVWDLYKENPSLYREKILLRPLAISNHPEVIRRLGVIALNTPIEFDIYGHANSTHVMGSSMMNGIGGSGDYMRNGYLTIFTSLSTAGKNDEISRIVPMCTHVDHTEHDSMVFITEWGVADVRGLPPRQRARKIIDNCAHPKFRKYLYSYLEEAEKNGGHLPVNLQKAFELHTYYMNNKTMVIDFEHE